MASNDDFQNSAIEDAQHHAFGPTVLEQVLFAIVKAHPPRSGGDSDRSRVNKAMGALLGSQQSQTPFDNNRFDKALRHMAKQRHIDEANVSLHQFKTRKEFSPVAPPAIRSYAELAREAASLYLPSENAEQVYSNAKRLEEMMSGRHQKKGGKHTDIDFERTYHFRAVEHDYVGETLEAEAVARICNELAEFGIATKR